MLNSSFKKVLTFCKYILWVSVKKLSFGVVSYSLFIYSIYAYSIYLSIYLSREKREKRMRHCGVFGGVIK